MKEASALDLLGRLKALGYRFVTISPASHARVLARPLGRIPTLTDIFGWCRPFREQDLPPDLLRLLSDMEALRNDGDALTSAVRVSTLGDDLFFHSAFPTDSPDSIFFGPDTYRFARFIQGRLPALPVPTHLIDMGCGSGAGGIVTARLCLGARLTLVDLNPAALDFAGINARAAEVTATLLKSDRVPPGGDLILANPPYMIDETGRAYRDGGGLFGGEVALEWVKQSLHALNPGGAMLLYTGAAVVDGRAPLTGAVAGLCSEAGATLTTEEIDPDVFGEELDQPAYRAVDRIAVLGMTIRLPG